MKYFLSHCITAYYYRSGVFIYRLFSWQQPFVWFPDSGPSWPKHRTVWTGQPLESCHHQLSALRRSAPRGKMGTGLNPLFLSATDFFTQAHPFTSEELPCPWRRTWTRCPGDTGCSWPWWHRSQSPSSTPPAGPDGYLGHFRCRRFPGPRPPWAAAEKPAPRHRRQRTFKNTRNLLPTELAAQPWPTKLRN